MGLLENITKLFRRDKDRTAVSASVGADVQLTDFLKFKGEFRGTPHQRAAAAEAHITVTRCINFIINNVINVDWQIMGEDMDGRNERVIRSHCKDDQPHAFKNMIAWHHQQYGINFFDRWLRMLYVHGNVYMEKLMRPGGSIPGGLRILNSMCVEPRIDNGMLIGFDYDELQNPFDLTIPRENILHDKYPSMLSDLRGKSPMDRALEAVNLDRYNMFTVRSWLVNDNKPSIIFTLHPDAPNYSEEELNEMLNNWIKQGAGPEKGYSSRLMTGPWQPHVVGTQRPDMQISIHMAILICREFGIDPSLVGVAEETEKANINERTAAFDSKFAASLTDTIKPCLYRMEEFINNHIMPFLCGEDTKERFCWCFENIDRMIKYSQHSVDQLRSDFLSGVITLNEYRQARFLSPLEEGGDVFNIPKGYVHVDREDMGTLSILKEIDPKALQEFMEERKETPAAFLASASPDFVEVAVSSDVQSENRYPVIE